MLSKPFKVLQMGRLLKSQRFLFSALTLKQSNLKDIFVQKEDDSYLMDLKIPRKDMRRFVLHQTDTLGTLIDNIKQEFPKHTVALSSHDGVKEKFLTRTTLLQFFNNENHVEITIDNAYQFALHNHKKAHSGLLKRISKQVHKKQGSTLYWKQQCKDADVFNTHQGVLSNLLNQLGNAVGSKKALTEAELDAQIVGSVKQFINPHSKIYSNLEYKKSTVAEAVAILNDEKGMMEKHAVKQVNMFQKALLGVSVVHVISFYYMIFWVEFLGWDICEPISYSFEQLTFFLGLLFYYRHGTEREFDTMVECSINSKLKKNNEQYDHYKNIKQLLKERKRELKYLDAQLELLRRCSQMIK